MATFPSTTAVCSMDPAEQMPRPLTKLVFNDTMIRTFYWLGSKILSNVSYLPDTVPCSPHPHRTTVRSICWWDPRATERMQEQSPGTVSMGTFRRRLASDQPGLARIGPLESDIASISALARNSPAVCSSPNHIISLNLVSLPLHEGKRELFYVPTVRDLVRMERKRM